MIPLPALPLPRIFSGLDPASARSFAMVFGPLLLLQWFLPWMGGSIWSWTTIPFIGGLLGTTLWSLIAGIGLTVIGYAPLSGLRSGHLFAIVAGSGLVGVLWTSAAAGGNPLLGGYFFFNLLGIFGLLATTSALFLWSRNGHKPMYTGLLWGGVVGLGLGLLIPFGGEIPLIMIFKVLGVDGFNIVARIFFMLLSLAFIFLVVLVVLNVLLKGESADKAQVERLGLAIFFFPFAALFLFGFFSFFAMFGIAMHTLIIHFSFLTLSVYGVVNLIEAVGRGDGIASLINAD
jgi:hypothetical protein